MTHEVLRLFCIAGMVFGIVMIVITVIGGYHYIKFMHEFYTNKGVPSMPPLPEFKREVKI